MESLYHIWYNYNMNNTVIFYEKENRDSPVEIFIESLPEKHQAKVYWEIELLEKYGKNLKEPYVKSIKGGNYKGLWELRIKFAKDISRIFYFIPIGNTFVLLHGFLKKTQATPVKELEIAKSRMIDYQRREKDEDLERS